MLLVRCPHPDCHNLMSEGAADCGHHAPGTKLCKRCGIRPGYSDRAWYCAECRSAMMREYKARHKLRLCQESKEQVRDEVRNVAQKPLTEAQIDALNASKRAADLALDRRLNDRCGYGHSPARSIPPEEWHKLNITPIDQIPGRHYGDPNEGRGLWG